MITPAILALDQAQALSGNPTFPTQSSSVAKTVDQEFSTVLQKQNQKLDDKPAAEKTASTDTPSTSKDNKITGESVPQTGQANAETAPSKTGSNKQEDAPAKEVGEKEVAEQKAKVLSAREISQRIELVKNELLNAKHTLTNQQTENLKLTADMARDKTTLEKLLPLQDNQAKAAQQNVASGEIASAVPAAESNVLKKTTAPPSQVQESSSAQASEAVRQDGKGEQTIETAPRSAQEAKSLLQPLVNALPEAAVVEVRTEPAQRPIPFTPFPAEFRERILQQAENGIQFLLSKGEGKMAIKLYPPELGNLQIELAVKDGKVDLRIHTETQTVREVMLSQLDQLKAGIENSGFQVKDMAVEIGGFRNPFAQTFQQEGRTTRKRFASFGEAENDSLRNSELNLAVFPYSLYIGRTINLLI